MKKNKRMIKYFIIISILIIGILPMVNLNKFAIEYDFKKLFNTDKVEMLVNYTFYKAFNRSLEKEKVIVGKDDFLFLGNSISQVLHKIQGLYKFNNKDIDNWTNKLKNIQTWYESRGIKFVVIIAPNKHSVYQDKLPNWLHSDTFSITDSIVDYSKKKNINMLDLRPLITESRSKYNDLLYLKTDTHWNGLGASIGYEHTIKFINSKYNITYDSPQYTYTNHDDKGKDLSNFLKTSTILPNNYEKSIWFKFKENHKICIGNIDKNTNELNKCNVTNNENLDTSQYSINKKSLNKMNLLMICDSFGRHNSQLYNMTFDNIWRFSYWKINGYKLSDFVNKHKPDVVVYQVVERDLYNNKLVKKLSDVSLTDDNNYGNKIFDINDVKYKYKEVKKDRRAVINEKLTPSKRDPIIILNELRTKSKFVKLNYNVDSSIKTMFQLFYKENKSDKYDENNSHKVVIKKGNNKISLSIPSKYINNHLRVELISKVGTFKINDFSLYEVE